MKGRKAAGLRVHLLIGVSFFLLQGCDKRPKTASPSPTPAQIQIPPPQPESPNPTQDNSPKLVLHKNSEAVVLGYHRFVSKVRHPDTEITPEDFEAQMQALKENGISVIAMQDYLAWRRGEKNIPPRCAILTIDDGYKSVYEVAWPILQKFGYPCTLFIYTDYIKGGPKSGGESLSWEQLAEMRDGGVDIQSHTISHKDLRGKRRGPQPLDYDQWLWNELNGSKQILESRLAIKVTALAVPYGYCNQQVREAAARAGYDAVFTVYGQKLNFSTPLGDLGRYIMESNKPDRFTTAIRFNQKPSGLEPENPGSSTAEIAVPALTPQPGDGEITHQSKPVIKANLQGIPEIEPGSIQMRISGLGVVPATYSPVSKSLAYNPQQDLRKGEYTVIISAKSQGRKAEARWKFRVE